MVPPMLTVPASGTSMKLMQRSKVDFPLPDGPMTAIVSPCLAVSEMSFKMHFPLKLLLIFFSSIMLCGCCIEFIFDELRARAKNKDEGVVADACNNEWAKVGIFICSDELRSAHEVCPSNSGYDGRFFE